MKIDISDMYSLTDKETMREIHIDMVEMKSKAGCFPIQAGEPFVLTIANEKGKRLRLTGEARLSARIPCDRCLEDVSCSFHLVIDKTVMLTQADDGQEDEDDEAASYIDEERVLDVDRLIFGELLVNWPAKVLCRDDCKGICPKCGTNLNRTACGCEQGVPDPRMAQFLDVFQKFKEV